MKDNQPDGPTHVGVDHYPGETGAENGALVPESPDDARLARAVAAVDFLAGVPDAVPAGRDIDSTLLGLIRAVLVHPNDDAARTAPADRCLELGDES